VWTYYGRTGLPHNRIYDLMHKAGVPISQQRICQPYGDDQRRGLWLFHILEPVTWSRVVARVAGANSGALYAGKSGNIQGTRIVTLPAGYTSWEAFARFLLDSMPAPEARHYKDKISVFLNHYGTRGYADGIPDAADPHAEAARKAPSWRRIAKMLLKNDRLCKALGFGQTKSDAYEKYQRIMRKRSQTWKLYLT
jgi:predicted phosphoadenosine phosphosulfate sulfurtransferase